MFVSDGLVSGVLDVLGLDTELTFTSLSKFWVLVELGSEGLQQSFEFSGVFLGNILDGNSGGGLLANELSESCLT